MVALARSGRPVDAMRSYERFRRRLVDEVGAVPARSLQRLNDDILRQVPGTEWEYSGPDPHAPAALTSGHVPRPVTSFVGRGDEVAELTDAVGPGSLTTLCGPAGVGKTRVAIEVARAAKADGRPVDGVWWCDLASVDPTLAGYRGDGVAIALSEALGASPEPAQPMRDRILEFLAGKDLWLVLDNCDNVVGPVADLVAAILQHAPDTAVLVTSREPLAIDGERRVDLDPLGDDAAIRLFADRAAAVSRGFELSHDNTDTVTEICRHLDGIPLAVELAAGRLTSVGVADLARLLDDRFRVLVSSRRDATDRHRTLRAAIDSSYDSLSADERAVFARLGVFPESFGLDAAECVCADGSVEPADVLELLSHLVARSLVVTQSGADGAVRYCLLESLRIYAVSRLAGLGDVSAASTYRRHAEHYAAVVDEAGAGITGPDETRWLGWLITEIPNCAPRCTGPARGATWTSPPDSSHRSTRGPGSATADAAEIGRWATLLARQPDIDQHPAYPAICEWGLRGLNRGSGDGTSRRPRVDPAGERARVLPHGHHTGLRGLRHDGHQPPSGDGDVPQSDEHGPGRGRPPHGSSAPHPDRQPAAPIVLAAGSRGRGAEPRVSGGGAGDWEPHRTRVGTDVRRRNDTTPTRIWRWRRSTSCRRSLPDARSPTPISRTAPTYVRGFQQLAEGDLAGLEPLRAEISAKTASGYRSMLTVHLVRLAQVFVHLDACLEQATELLAGVRAHHMVFTHDRRRVHRPPAPPARPRGVRGSGNAEARA